MTNKWGPRTVQFGLVISLALLASGCGNSAAREAKSSSNMKLMFADIMVYNNNNGKYPESLDELKSAAAGLGQDFSALLVNPATGDNPGYEYVKPTRAVEAADGVIMYQLRDGKRDMTLPVLYVDGAVGKIR